MEDEAFLARGRAFLESRMRSRCTVARKTGEKITVDRMQVDEYGAVHTDIPFRLDGGATGDGGSRTVTIGDVTYETATGLGHMPASTVDLADEDLIEITSGEWAGALFRIVKAVKKDQATARRVPIAETARPDGWPA